MSVTFDANILVYASNTSDPVHERAAELVRGLAAGPGLVYAFWPALMGYLRIVTHPSILPQPLSASAALGNVGSLVALRHVRTPGEADGFLDLYRATLGDRARGNAVPETHLVTLMRQHGVRTIYSRDRDLRRFDGIAVEDPFA